MRLLQYLIEGRDVDYTLTDMLNANVSWGTLHHIVPLMLECGLLVQTRKIGRATLYKINQKNEVAQQFIVLYDKLLSQRLHEIQEVTEVIV